ncbi:MAG: EF-hand domain-containing protein [Sphingomicrobium sp.]
MKTLLIAASAALAGTAALAQTATPPPASVAPTRPMADGVMTRTEVVEKVRNHFSRFDADKDGSITTAEIGARHGKMVGRRMAEGGQPHVMVREHAMRDPNAAFDRLDTNKDGAISRDEFAKGREMRTEKRIVRREKIREAHKDGKLGAMRMHRLGGTGGARMIVMADTDKDGRITLSEAETMALQHFDRMDSNRDGQVTREERRAGRMLMIRKVHTPDAG